MSVNSRVLAASMKPSLAFLLSCSFSRCPTISSNWKKKIGETNLDWPVDFKSFITKNSKLFKTRAHLPRFQMVKFPLILGLLVVYYSKIISFLVFYSNSTTYKNMKTLNYGQKRCIVCTRPWRKCLTNICYVIQAWHSNIKTITLLLHKIACIS
jgi:hypothetical protein